MSFFTELQRRNVFRVAALYVVGGWLILQVGDLLFDLMGLPDFALRIVLGILLLGMPAALVLAWVYEITPEGIKRESQVDRSASMTADTGRKLNIAVLAAVVLALGALGLDRLLPETEVPAAVSQAPAVAEKSSPAETADAGDRTSIAVLPFADMSAEGDQGYFADGISEEMLNVLAQIDGLKVASRTSSFAYKGLNQNIRSIAQELGVNHVLEGSVRKAGTRVRITAQLIQAESDEHLWSDSYDRELDDIFAIQEEIARSILAALGDALGVAEVAEEIRVATATENLSAYELFLEGRELFLLRQELERAMELLETAVRLDSNFARAWAQLAGLYTIAESWGIRDRSYGPLAVEAADRAIAIDPTIALAYAVKGNAAFALDRDWNASFQFFDQAIALDPNNATTIFWRSVNWLSLGYFDRAAIDLERCLEIDPAYGNCIVRTGLIANLRGDEETALRLLLEANELGNESLWEEFYPALLRDGQRFGVLWSIRRMLDRFDVDVRGFPMTLVLDAYAGKPLNEEERERVLVWAEFFNNLPLAVGAFERVSYEPFSGNLWQTDFIGFYRSARFKELVEDMGGIAFWREHGFPAQCRPVGEDDFECDMP